MQTETPAQNIPGTDNAPVVTPPTEVAEPTIGDAQIPQGDGSDAIAVEPTGDTESASQDNHTTRAERRIQQLSNRVRDNEVQQPAQLPELPELLPQIETETETEAPEQTPEDILENGGEMTTEDLEQLISRGVDTRLNEREDAQVYEQAMTTFESDITSLTAEHPELDPESDVYNPELDNMLTELITQANVLPDGTVYPRVLASSLYGRMTNIMNAERQAGTEQASIRLADQVSEQAVPTGATSAPTNKQYTPEEVRDLRMSNPREYKRLVKEGVI